MTAFECTVTCRSGRALRALIICEGKERIPELADLQVFPEDATGIEDVQEIDLPAAYLLPDGS